MATRHATTPIRAFNSGELSPQLAARTDKPFYTSGCRTLQNMVALPHGGVTRRPGLRFIHAARSATTTARLIEFVFGDDDAYVLEFGHYSMRVYRGDGLVLTEAGHIYQIFTPYPAAVLRRLQYTQSGDVIFIACPDTWPMTLTRYGHTEWRLGRYGHVDGPYLDENTDSTVTMTVSATESGATTETTTETTVTTSDGTETWTSTWVGDVLVTSYGTTTETTTTTSTSDGWYEWQGDGTALWVTGDTGETVTEVTEVVTTPAQNTVTVTCSAAVFSPDDYGRLIRINEEGASHYDQWLPQTEYAVDAMVWYNGNVYRCTVAGTSGSRSPVHTSGSAGDGVCSWEYTHSGYGYARFQAYISPTQAAFYVISRLPDSALTGTQRWQWGAWRRGTFPMTVTRYGERLIWAGAHTMPETLWASEVADYDTFTPDALDDGPITVTLSATKRVAAIRWIAGGPILMIGTEAGVINVDQPTGEPLTPTNGNYVLDVAWGSSQVQPVQIGEAFAYVQRFGKKIRKVSYDISSDGLVAVDLTILSEHLTGSAPIVELAWTEEPNAVLWALRADGTLLGFTFQEEHGVAAWHRHPLSSAAGSEGDRIESICAIPGPSGDQLWCLVARQVAGVTRRTVERMDPWFGDATAAADAFFVDSGLTYRGAATTRVVGLSHLEGRTVSVLVDGAEHPDQVVGGGAVDLAWAGSVVHVGLPYAAIVEPMPLVLTDDQGPTIGRPVRIDRAWVQLYRSAGAQVGRPDKVYDMPRRAPADPMDRAVPLTSAGVLVEFNGRADPAAPPEIRIIQTRPLPLTVLGIHPQGASHGRD